MKKPDLFRSLILVLTFFLICSTSSAQLDKNEYDVYKKSGRNLTIVCKDLLWGVVKNNGRVVVKPQYDTIYQIGRAHV